MSNGSPTAYLLWAILSCIFLSFLLLHLWSYDRFKCLKWDSGRQPGAFKRVMTYSYVCTVPILVVFSVAMTVIKFKEGFTFVPFQQLFLPKPFELYDKRNERWLLPLFFVLSVGWSLELVTHLEELAFWLFLFHQGPKKREWFHSWEFRTWYLGSTLAIIGMPLTALTARGNLESCLAWIFLVGSSAGTSTTLIFLYVLARFPFFIRQVKLEGALPDVVFRLATFYRLNVIRVIFRFLFTLPLLVLAMDVIRGPHVIVRSAFWFDFLLMIGGIGCFVSSAITLLIFFPRSFVPESDYQVPPTLTSKTPVATSPLPNYYAYGHDRPESVSSPKSVILSPQNSIAGTRLAAFRFPITTSPPPHNNQYGHQDELPHPMDDDETPEYESEEKGGVPPPADPPTFTARSRPLSDGMMWERHSATSGWPFPGGAGRERVVVAISGTPALQEAGGVLGSSQLHPYVMTFKSPIDLLDVPDDDPPS